MTSMNRTKKGTMLFQTYICICLFLLTSTCSLSGQTPVSMPAPSDFANAHTVFVASAGAPALAGKEKEACGMVYASLTRQIAAWNHFQLVDTPKQADLVFEISVAVDVSAVSYGTSTANPYLRINIRDVKTQSPLWTLDEPIQGAFFAKTFGRNADHSVELAIDDLKALVAGKLPFPPPSN